MKILRTWHIPGTDGNSYTVQERDMPGRFCNPTGGRRRAVATGLVEYVLADGSDVTDGTPGMWETMTGVLLKKPDDL